LLDFGSHENCPGCLLAYPLLRSALERWHGRPFVILGINTNCRLDTFKEAITKGEITRRCWWEANQADGPGPITTSWNIRGFPMFFLSRNSHGSWNGCIARSDCSGAQP
jgi:hypothetical protein